MTMTTNNLQLPDPSPLDQLNQKYQLHFYKKREVFRELAKQKFANDKETAEAALRLLYKADTLLKGMLVFSPVNYFGGNTLEENTAMTVWDVQPSSYAEIIVASNKKIRIGNSHNIGGSHYTLSWFRNWVNNNLSSTFDQLYLVPFGDNTYNFFNGKKFCVTGKTKIRRETIKFLVTALGGAYLTQISGNTDYLIVLDEEEARKPSTKLKKAKELYKDLKIITEKEFVKMLPELPELDQLSI